MPLTTRISPGAQSAADRLLNQIFLTRPGEAMRYRHSVFRLAKEFEQYHGRAPDPAELQEELIQRTDEKGHISFFFNKVAKEEKTYADIFRQHMGTAPTAPYINRHNVTYGYLDSLNLKALGIKKDIYEDLKDHIKSHLVNHQSCAAEATIKYAESRLSKGIYDHLIKEISNYYKIMPTAPTIELEGWTYTENQVAHREKMLAAGEDLGLPIECLYGFFEANILDEHGTAPYNFNTVEYLKIREFLTYESDNLRKVNSCAAFATCLFSDYATFISYVERWPTFITGRLSLIKNVEIQTIPDSAAYTEWAKGFLRYGPQMLYYFKINYNDTHEPIDVLPRNREDNILLQKLKDILYKNHLECVPVDNPDFMDLHRFCFDHQLTEEEFEGAQFLISRFGDRQEEPGFIPDVRIEGHKFGLPGFVFEKLDRDDYRSLFPGRFTGCCERLLDYCQPSVLHAYATRESAFYVIKDTKNRIVSHSWAWRDPQRDALVLDGFEALQNDARITDHVLTKCLSALVRELEHDAYADFKIPAILLGVSGKSLKLHYDLPPAIKVSDERSRYAEINSDEISEKLGLAENFLGYSDDFFVFHQFRNSPDYYKPEDEKKKGPEPR